MGELMHAPSSEVGTPGPGSDVDQRTLLPQESISAHADSSLLKLEVCATHLHEG